MLTEFVVEIHGDGHFFDDLLGFMEGLSEQQIVLHGAVDALCLDVLP